MIPGMEGPPPPANKVIDLSSVRAGAGQEQTDPAKEGGQEWEKPQEAAEPPRRGRRPKNKEAPAQEEKPKRKGRPPKTEKQAPGGGGAGRAAKTPRQGKAASQPALVRPREGGGYEIIAGHRRQRASELAGYKNMPCIVRNMTDDEAVLAMTDDNLRHRETILPSEKAAALKQQYEAIKHQGTRGDGADLGKLSLDKVGERNGMSSSRASLCSISSSPASVIPPLSTFGFIFDCCYRHTYAVSALMGGDDIKTVQENLGHATAAFTLDVYCHATGQMKRNSADRMEDFIQSVS